MFSRLSAFCLLLIVPAQAIAREKPLPQPEQELVRQTVWGTADAKKKALDELRRWPVTPERIRQVETIIRAGRIYSPMPEHRQTVTVPIDDKRKVNALVQLPSGYDPTRRYPLMIAIGGGPPPNDAGAAARAKTMLALWSKPANQAGWIVAAIEDTPSVRLPGKPLRYFILHADNVRVIRDALLEKYAIDCNRIHVTGISLGSNYALAYAAAHPDWFAGIAPVSTEGESREFAVRNLKHVGVYVLEGAKDKAIRTIDGPRKMVEILKNFGYAHVYEEDPNRGHEGFMPKYPQVLKWLAERPRPAFPKEIIRLYHGGIIVPGKRFYWLEGDTHQAAFTAKVAGNTIDVQAARVRRLTFHLSDRLLDLSAPVTIRVNGRVVHNKVVLRSLLAAVEDAATLNDTERFATARLTVDVPDQTAGEKWLASLAPKVEPSRLPYWEDFALTTLKERRPALAAELEPVKETSNLPPWKTALRVKTAPDGSPLRAGDFLLGFDHEPLFTSADCLAFLNSYLLRTTAKSVSLQIKRDGKAQEVVIDVAAATGPEVKPTTKLWEWERGIAVESRDQKDMAVFLWFYEWNMFDAVKKGEHTLGTFKWPRKFNEAQTEAVIGSDDMRVTVKATDGGADLLLTVTNKSDHDWPEIAGIIPCFSPGKNGDNPRNPQFANEKTYYLGPKGLEPLKKREIHFNGKFRKAVEAISRQGQFVFSDKWPTAEPDAKGGVIIRESTDDRWVTGIAWDDYLSVQGHNPWRCMHLCVRVGPLKRRETKRVRGKIYLFKGKKEDCLQKYRHDFPKAAKSR